MQEEAIGTVTHYFAEPSVAVVHLTQGALHPGDRIHVLGHTTDFAETVTSLEWEHKGVSEALAGEDVAVAVIDRARRHDQVFKIV
jgi:translation elongation factor EF-Tu-like GTPase